MIYLNNAATTFPKPPSVLEAVTAALAEPPVSPLRSNGDGEDLLTGLRRLLGRLFNISDWERIFFCSGATDAVNRIVDGLSWKSEGFTMDSHNSVLRPLANKLVASDDGEYNFLFLNHCNNVTGEICDIPRTWRARKKGSGDLLMVDASQSAGCIPIDVDGWGVDILVFTVHKSLYGPMGTGGYYVRRGIDLWPSQFGGTGRDSQVIEYAEGDWEYEVGTQNMPGLAGLKAGVEYVLERGVENILKKEQQMTQQLIDELGNIPGVKLYVAPMYRRNAKVNKRQGPVVSFNIKGLKPSDVGYILQNSYGITVRTGLHCAPLVHEQLRTARYGTVRVSLSDLTTWQDLEALITAVREIVQSL